MTPQQEADIRSLQEAAPCTHTACLLAEISRLRRLLERGNVVYKPCKDHMGYSNWQIAVSYTVPMTEICPICLPTNEVGGEGGERGEGQ